MIYICNGFQGVIPQMFTFLFRNGVWRNSVILHELDGYTQLRELECACDIDNCVHGNNWPKASIAL